MRTSTRLRAGALVGVLALAGGLALPSAAFAAEPPVIREDPIRLESGHVDAFNLVLNEDDSARLVLKEDVTGSGVMRTPESVELFLKSDAYSTNLPAQSMPPGSPSALHHIPDPQDHTLLWPGWDSARLAPVYGADATVDYEITSVEGPGDVYLWTRGNWGVLASVLKDGGYELPNTIAQNFLGHVHANWGFTEPGTYALQVQATATSKDGTKTSTTNAATYTFEIAPFPTAVTVSGAENAVEPGSELTLSAAQTPAGSSLTGYTWSTRSSESAEWQTVSGATGPTLTVAAADGAQYRAAVAGGKDYATGTPQPIVVESAPVTISAPAQVEQTIAIAPLAHHYHSNSPIDLAVTADPAVEHGVYRWSVQRTDQEQPVVIEGVTGATHRLTAEQALHGAEVTVELIGEGDAVLATADAVTIDVDDHGAAPLQKVTIEGLGDHVHTGDTVTLSAAVAPASVLDRFEWYVQLDGETAPVRVEGEHDASYSFTATEELAGAAVIAKLTYDDARPYVESAPVIVKLDDHHVEVPDTDLTISTNRDADDYWVGQTATLTAQQSTPTGLSEYRWLVKAPGADDFEVVDGQTAAEYAFKPTLANRGIQVMVQLLHDGEVHAESDPVTITAQQRDVVTTLTVSADQETYAPGDTARLVSTQSPQTDHDHYHWYVKRAGASDFVWVDQSRDKDLDYPVTAEDDGAQLVIRMFDDTHAVIAESEPYTLDVVTGGSEPEPITELTIDGLASGYYAGDTATLTAVQNPATDEDHYHWFIKRAGDADFSVVPGAFSAQLEHVVAAEDAGAQLVAKLYDHDHAVIAESDAVALTVLPGSPKPGDAPHAQTGAALEGVTAGGIAASTTTPAQGQVITVQVGTGDEFAGEWVAAWLFSEPTLLGGDWVQVGADGTIAVTIPADATVGDHRLAAFDAAGELIGWQQLQIQAATTDGSSPAAAPGTGLASTGAELPIGLATGAGRLLLLGAGVLLLRARRRSAQTAE